MSSAEKVDDFGVPDTEKQALIEQLSLKFTKFHPLHKKYKFSRLKLERIFRKPSRHNVRFLKKMMAFCGDLELIHKKITGILEAPLARHPDFWDNLNTLFNCTSEHERIPELNLLSQYYKQFNAVINNFLVTNKANYANKKPPVDTEGN